MSLAFDILTELTDTEHTAEELQEFSRTTIKFLEDYLEVLEQLNSVKNNAVLRFEEAELRQHIILLREQSGESFEEDKK